MASQTFNWYKVAIQTTSTLIKWPYPLVETVKMDEKPKTTSFWNAELLKFSKIPLLK
jgi:hypothetical protein